jgi:hypothetical protein
MKTGVVRKTSVALVAAVALFFVAGAFSQPPEIISSFRMSGVTPPYARGIFAREGSSTIYGIFYEGPYRHSFRVFTSRGSLVATYPMPGGALLGDADYPPVGSQGHLAVIDEGTHDLKAYSITGNYLGIVSTVPRSTVGYACGGEGNRYAYLADNGGVVYRYSPTWSIINSFATGVPAADLAASRGYADMRGDWVILGPAEPPAALRAYTASGSFYGSFALPGNSSRGSVYGGGNRTTMVSLRNLGKEMWVYVIDTGSLTAVEPASLGKVKALFK